MLKTYFKQKSTCLLMVLFSLYVYTVCIAQICFTTSNLSLCGYSKKYHDLLPVSMKYQCYDFIYAVLISGEFMKGRYIFQTLFIYYYILKYPNCSSVLHLLKIVPKTFTNVLFYK